jgi:hypothetical protein
MAQPMPLRRRLAGGSSEGLAIQGERGGGVALRRHILKREDAGLDAGKLWLGTLVRRHNIT